MDIKECHRVLEIELGASRDAVETAYCNLLERWHPDRVQPPDDPAGLREANRMVQLINEAYQTLIKTAPPPKSGVTAPPVPIRERPAPVSPPPSSEAAAPRAKPTLGAQNFTLPPTEDKPEPRKPSAALPPLPAQSSTPPAPTPPPPDKPLPPPKPAPAAPPPAPAPPEARPTRQRLARIEEPGKWAKAKAVYDMLFPEGTPRRRFAPHVLAATLVVLLLLGRCALSSSSHKGPREPDPKTTGIVIVKSNRPDTVVELSGVPGEHEGGQLNFNGSGPEATMRGLPPGKYNLNAKSEGWPEIRQEVTATVAQTTTVEVHFKSGSLRLDSDPTGATVRLGENELGRTPLVIPQLPPGECNLSLVYPSWPVMAYKTNITENVESTETVRLPYGRITVETSPAGATILFAGRAVGQTPLTIDHIPAGNRKLTLQAKNFPPLELPVVVTDGGEVKINRELGTAFPEFDPSALLSAVWVPDDSNNFAVPFDSDGVYAPRNGVVKHLNRKRLYTYWLRKQYRYTAVIKAYDKESGKIESAEQKGELTAYRVLAELSSAARNDKELTAQLVKGATFTFYGRLDAAEEPRFLSKTITFEFAGVEPLH